MASKLEESDTNATSSHYTAAKYIDIVEKTKNKMWQRYMQAERNAITKDIEDPGAKTFIDLGAGYGRVLPYVAPIARNVISIELNPDMFAELQKRSKKYQNSVAVLGDLNNLQELLSLQDVVKPVFLLMQNSLGTLSFISPSKLLKKTGSIAKEYKGEFVISLFRQEALKDAEVDIYGSAKDIVGEPDLEKTDFKKGVFVSKTGYKSKWWSRSEIEEIKIALGGLVINEHIGKEYHIVHLSFTVPSN
jgi:SAM-dependent methyltransferase